MSKPLFIYAVVCLRSTHTLNGLIALVTECPLESSVSAYFYQKEVLPYHQNPVSLAFFPAFSEFPVTKSKMSVSVIPGYLHICTIHFPSPFICVTVFVLVSYLLMSSTL